MSSRLVCLLRGGHRFDREPTTPPGVLICKRCDKSIYVLFPPDAGDPRFVTKGVVHPSFRLHALLEMQKRKQGQG